MYSYFKLDLGDVMVDFLQPIQQKYEEISQNKAFLESILKKGAENAYYRARKTLSKVYRKVGFIPNISVQ
jgi:tryptophanyl-tRNA synthetase